MRCTQLFPVNSETTEAVAVSTMKNSAQAPHVMRLFVWPTFCCLGASLVASADILVLDKARSDVKFTCSAGLIPVRGNFAMSMA